MSLSVIALDTDGVELFKQILEKLKNRKDVKKEENNFYVSTLMFIITKDLHKCYNTFINAAYKQRNYISKPKRIL